MNNTLGKKIDQLSPELQREVENFVDELLRRKEQKQPGAFRFDWEGALEDLRNKYSSVDLQHKVLEWWGD